jgi:hypothetical protein
MHIIVKVLIFLIEGVICQVHVGIIRTFLAAVFFASKAHKPIIEQEDGHWVNNRCDQNVDAEVEFVVLPQGWVLYVLLHNVR